MKDIEETFEDRPEILEEESGPTSDPFDFANHRGFGAALGLALFLLPVGLMVGAMRWNIAPTMDADLRWILTKFCDTVLLFCIALPICPLLPGEWGSKLSQKVFKGLWRLLMVAKWIGILAFIVAALWAIGYIFWMIWELIIG